QPRLLLLDSVGIFVQGRLNAVPRSLDQAGGSIEVGQGRLQTVEYAIDAGGALKQFLKIVRIGANRAVQLAFVEFQIAARRQLEADFRQVLITTAVRVGGQKNRFDIVHRLPQHRVAAKDTLGLLVVK